MLDRVIVLAAAPGATLLALLLELLLSFGVGEAKEKLDAIRLNRDIVEIFDDLFSNVASVEALTGQQ